MASHTHTQTFADKQVEVPEWEHSGTANNAEPTNHGPASTHRQKLDSTMPPHKKYLGMKRNIFLLVLLATILALIALIVGLAVALTQGSGSKNLPLPSNSETFSGELTYYETGLGACGLTSTSSDNIVSVSHIIFDAAGSSSSTGGNSNSNPLCGLMLRATRYDEDRGEQRSIDLKVVDRCTGCQPNDIDVSYSAFDKLASRDRGRVDVTWAWL